MPTRICIPEARKLGLPYEEPAVVYIGRRLKNGPYNFEASPLQNPYPVKSNGRQKAVRLFRELLESSVVLLDHVDALEENDTLACWCSRFDPCHGDIIIEVWNERRNR